MSEAAEKISGVWRAGISFAIHQRCQWCASQDKKLCSGSGANLATAAHSHSAVIAGLDPAIQLLAKRMDARVKPGHDAEGVAAGGQPRP
jgi:hypothetical protein